MLFGVSCNVIAALYGITFPSGSRRHSHYHRCDRM